MVLNENVIKNGTVDFPENFAKYISIQSAMELLGVSRKTLDRYAKKGLIKKIRRGGKGAILFCYEDLKSLYK